MKPELSLDLARIVTEKAEDSFNNGEMMEKVSPVTAELLNFWFNEPYCSERRYNFHEGQRQAILNVIYLHEVIGIQNVGELYEKAAPELTNQAEWEQLAKEKYRFPKYAIKMATGTGKTWVMHALMIWQILNARHEETKSGRFVKHFLIVAPGLIVYDRLLDAYLGRINPQNQKRDITTNDFYRNQELFIPNIYRNEVFSFIENNVVSKEEGIGRKTTGEGLIALTNWHLFLSNEEETSESDNNEPKDIIHDLFPVSPGITSGNALDTLDQQYLRGNDLDFLAGISDLMVFNDEAHHIHENRVSGEVEEVEWQKGLNRIFEKKKWGKIQIDFSATPYDTSGSGKNKIRHYFPHIVTNFELETAMRKGLVKTLLLDKRQELTDLQDLDYKAVRDERGKVIGLSDGQRLMLRAGLKKLNILENSFKKLDKYPKMLVMCEDTNVTPFVENFLQEEGLSTDDILRIDSNRKGELKESEWLPLKEKLFNVDQYEKPRVIVSVLMLREGFDVNNICVIVPLRSSESDILLEQTIGRGLRLMWREEEYREEKMENRRRVLVRHQAPRSYIDMLSIIEHPKFEAFYNRLMNEGLAGTDEGEIGEGGSAAADFIKVGLKENYKDFDLFWPLVIRDAEEEITPAQIDIAQLAVFQSFPLEKLRRFLATDGETFISKALPTETQFGKYEVKADLFTATSYNEYLQKILRTITTRIDRIGIHKQKELPTLQINQQDIVRLLDIYIRTRLFGQPFNPFAGNDWKILLAKEGIVTAHIVKEMSIAIHHMQENVELQKAIVEKIYFSSVPTLKMRESYSLQLEKVIYERMGYPSHNGGFEKSFLEFLDSDAEVESFIKINETQHLFASIYYIRTDGLLASYHPDFMVKTEKNIYIIETKGNDKVHDHNVQQKKKSISVWCKKINQLPEELRMNRKWEYVLLAERDFYGFAKNGATLSDICRLKSVSVSEATGNLFADL